MPTGEADEPPGQLPGQRSDGQLLRLAQIELVHGAVPPTRDAVRAALFDYVEVFYNRRRLQSALAYRASTEARTALTDHAALAA